MIDINKALNEYFLTKSQFNQKKQAGTLEVGAVYHITDEHYTEKPYTLIETITLTEDTTAITRTNYNYQSLFLSFQTPKVSANNFYYFSVNSTVLNYGMMISIPSALSASYTFQSAVLAEIDKTLPFLKAYSYAGTTVGSQSTAYRSFIIPNPTKLTGFHLQTSGGTTVPIPSGTIIKIYAR